MGSPLQLISRVEALRRLRDKRQAERRARARQRSTEVPGCVLDFIPWANPGWQRPDHLATVAEDVDRAFTEEVESFCTVPPRHGKSEVLLNGTASGLRRHPDVNVLYATHTQRFADKQSKRIKKLARLAGVEITEGSNRADEWETTAGGGVVARGFGGEVTGRGFKVIIVDDPIKSREQAESKTYRNKIWDWLTDDVFSRGTPDVAIIVVHTRWHPDDPIGRLMGEGWSGLELRAIAEEDSPDGRAPGEALWPWLWPADKLQKRRRLVGEYGWASLYQGRPRPRGGKVFGPPTFYRELPRDFRRGYGVDLAYTAKTQSDRSVVIEMLREDRPRDLPLFYLRKCISEQEQAPRFAKRLKAAQVRAPGPMLFIGAGTERGAADFVSQKVPRFVMEPPAGDKLVRALDFAAAWNDGRVLLPDPEVFDVPWLSDLLDVFDSFTGVNDPRDDEVDAAAAAHKVLDRAASSSFAAYT